MNPSFPTTSKAAFLGLTLAAAALFLSACGQSAPPAPEPTPTPAPTPAATVAATPTPVAAATPTPTVMEVAKYNGQQQMQYMATAREAYIADRAAKSQPYIDAHNALEAAGGFNAAGLTTKDAIAARRDLIAKAAAANDDYLNFVKTQEDTYRAELAKTPLLPGDVDSIVKDYASKANTAAVAQLREDERESLKAGDDMMAALEKSFGDWSANGGKLLFKKKPAQASYAAAAQKFNKAATDESKLLDEVNKALVVPSASAPPAASPGASASPAATASPSPAASAAH